MEHVGQGFVELVENGITSGPVAEKTVRESLLPLLHQGADTIVLGCTHYPFLSKVILDIASEIVQERHVNIIDPAPAVARHLMEVMQEDGLIRRDGFSMLLESSGDLEKLEYIYNNLL